MTTRNRQVPSDEAFSLAGVASWLTQLLASLTSLEQAPSAETFFSLVKMPQGQGLTVLKPAITRVWLYLLAGISCLSDPSSQCPVYSEEMKAEVRLSSAWSALWWSLSKRVGRVVGNRLGWELWAPQGLERGAKKEIKSRLQGRKIWLTLGKTINLAVSSPSLECSRRGWHRPGWMSFNSVTEKLREEIALCWYLYIHSEFSVVPFTSSLELTVAFLSVHVRWHESP